MSDSVTSGSGRRVLLVDDERHIVEILARKLAGLGHETMTANNGEVALEMLRSGDIHLVVTDLDMPRMTGVDLVQAMSKDAALCGIPVIMLTARGFLASAQELKSIVATVSKPFSTRKVIELICAQLATGGKRGENASEIPA